MTENTVLRIIKERELDNSFKHHSSSFKHQSSLFDAFGPTGVHHVSYVNDSGIIIVTSEDTSQEKAENRLLGYKTFYDRNDFNEWKNSIYKDDSYARCRVSYRAYIDICEDSN